MINSLNDIFFLPKWAVPVFKKKKKDMHVWITGVFVCEVWCSYAVLTDISNTEKGKQEGKEGRGKCEELPVSLEDLEVVRQACDYGLHATHLVGRKTGSNTNRSYEPRGYDDYVIWLHVCAWRFSLYGVLFDVPWSTVRELNINIMMCMLKLSQVGCSNMCLWDTQQVE